jgi:hypothetical protein
MRNHFMDSIRVGMAVIAFMPLMLAQTAPRSGAARSTPDLSGVYDRGGRLSLGGAGSFSVGERRRGDVPPGAFASEEPPMQPWALEKFKTVRAGIPDLYEAGRDDLDPEYNCFPPGPTRIFTTPRPFEIRQFPDRLLILFEADHWVRRIYLDGRGHADDYPITWMGHSTGKWEGDTLVVDTVGINEISWLDSLGHPHSDALHVVERFRRVQNMLEIEFLFDDPKAYTKSWTGKKVFQLMPPDYEILEHVNCEEHLLEEHLPKIQTRTVGPR